MTKNMIIPVHLTDAELVETTHRRQPRAQAKALESIGVPFKRRPDGTLLVGRSALESALAGAQATMQGQHNGLQWSKSE